MRRNSAGGLSTDRSRGPGGTRSRTRTVSPAPSRTSRREFTAESSVLAGWPGLLPARHGGLLINGAGLQGETETACECAAAFEDDWLELVGHLNPGALVGTRDPLDPVYVQTPVNACPSSPLRSSAPSSEPSRTMPPRC